MANYEDAFLVEGDLEIHPAALIMPPMDDEHFKEFKEDISGIGLLDPIELFEGKIIDGRNRYLACKELEIDVWARQWEGGYDPIEYVISKNLHRRHLTASQRAMSAAKALDFYTSEAKKRMSEGGGDKKSEEYKKSGGVKLPHPINHNKDNITEPISIFDEPVKIKDENGRAAEKAAKDFNVSASSIKTAKAVIEKGTDEEITAVETGKVSVSAIAKDIKEREKLKPSPSEKPVFNKTNDSVSWAKWTWNPVTGCLHDCKYCYARDIANRFYEEKFKPTFRPERLDAPKNTSLPKTDDDGMRRVFVCSMADLFGAWVEQEWIDKVLDSCRNAPDWTFIFLTKNPDRLVGIEWPENAWVGMTIDTQERADKSKDALLRLNKDHFRPSVIFISFEPLLEEITLDGALSSCDWVIIGGRSSSSGMPAGQPKWEWVEALHYKARRDGCKVYWKPNLEVKPQEMPL